MIGWSWAALIWAVLSWAALVAGAEPLDGRAVQRWWQGAQRLMAGVCSAGGSCAMSMAGVVYICVLWWAVLNTNTHHCPVAAYPSWNSVSGSVHASIDKSGVCTAHSMRQARLCVVFMGPAAARHPACFASACEGKMIGAKGTPKMGLDPTTS